MGVFYHHTAYYSTREPSNLPLASVSVGKESYLLSVQHRDAAAWWGGFRVDRIFPGERGCLSLWRVCACFSLDRRLGPALRDLENHKRALGIVSYGVFAPTMHDVFTRVCAKRSQAAGHQEVSPRSSVVDSPTPSRTGGAQMQAEATKACTSDSYHQSQHAGEPSRAFPSPPSPPLPCFWRQGLSSDPTCNRRSRLADKKERKAESEPPDTLPRQHPFFKVSRTLSANAERESSREEDRRQQQQQREVQLVPLDERRLLARRTNRDPARERSVYGGTKEDHETNDCTPAVQDPPEAEIEGIQDEEGRRRKRAMLEEPPVCSVCVPTGQSTRGTEQTQQSSQPDQDHNESLSRSALYTSFDLR